jgi:hypothetical protein
LNEENVSNFKYSVYPNPASDQFLVKAELSNPETVQFSLFNLLGERILSEIQRDVNGQVYFDISSEGLTKGTYIGVLQIGSERATQTIVIQ